LRKKGVLFITNLELWSMNKGSGAPSLAQTINAYLGGGYQVYVITGSKANWIRFNDWEDLIIKGFDCPGFKRLLKIKKIGFLTKALWWIWFQTAAFCLALPLLVKKKIDLVYGYEMTGVPVAYSLAKLFGLKVVSRFQGSVLGFFIGRPLWQIRAWDHILALKIPTDMMIMTNDGQEEDKLLQLIGARAKRIFFWRNGVNKNMIIPDFDRQRFLEKLEIDSSRFIILAVSRLNQWKRVDRLITALPELVSRCDRVQALIVGDGELREDLEKQVDRLGVNSYVKFVGSIPQSRVREYLNGADLFVSFYDSSNVGNPLLEAMSCGKCIITLNNGSTGQLIKNNQNGILLELDQLEELPDQMMRLIEDAELRLQLGKAAREDAEKTFWTWEERMREELEQVGGLIGK
jgi:glycosyltransferase involved in cell wall biosynthesis